jgi:hypothetical protein
MFRQPCVPNVAATALSPPSADALPPLKQTCSAASCCPTKASTLPGERNLVGQRHLHHQSASRPRWPSSPI